MVGYVQIAKSGGLSNTLEPLLLALRCNLKVSLNSHLCKLKFMVKFVGVTQRWLLDFKPEDFRTQCFIETIWETIIGLLSIPITEGNKNLETWHNILEDGKQPILCSYEFVLCFFGCFVICL